MVLVNSTAFQFQVIEGNIETPGLPGSDRQPQRSAVCQGSGMGTTCSSST